MNADDNDGRYQTIGAGATCEISQEHRVLNGPIGLEDVNGTDAIDNEEIKMASTSMPQTQSQEKPEFDASVETSFINKENLIEDYNYTNAVPGHSKPTKISSHSVSVWSIASVVCRICHNGEEPERLISPCRCKGTLAYVHKNCLEHWLRTSGMISCELCHFKYKVKSRLRYSCWHALRMWYRHPNNRGLLQADLLVGSILTVVSFGLIGISAMALQYFVVQGKRFGVSRFWTYVSIMMFLTLIFLVYCVNMSLIIRTQLVPWYRWWQSAKDITLILENRKAALPAINKTTPNINKNTDEVEVNSTLLTSDISTTTTGTLSTTTATNIAITEDITISTPTATASTITATISIDAEPQTITTQSRNIENSNSNHENEVVLAID